MSLKIKATFIQELLGSSSGNPEIHREYIASKAPNAQLVDDETANISVDEAVAKQMTVFPRLGGEKGNPPIIYNYQVKGLFKGAAAALSNIDNTLSKKKFFTVKGKVARSGQTGYQKIIDRQLFVGPREMILTLPKGEKIETKQRSLRAMTMQGERITLAHSEVVPVGTTFEFEVFGPLKMDLTKDVKDLVCEWLSYAEDGGFLQWRNGGFGCFTYKVIK